MPVFAYFTLPGMVTSPGSTTKDTKVHKEKLATRGFYPLVGVEFWSLSELTQSALTEH
jgi:hypothetical protein